MQSVDKDIADYPPRDRPVITESDLESNYELLKETVYACFENSMKPGVQHEIPVLADFEACFDACVASCLTFWPLRSSVVW